MKKHFRRLISISFLILAVTAGGCARKHPVAVNNRSLQGPALPEPVQAQDLSANELRRPFVSPEPEQPGETPQAVQNTEEGGNGQTPLTGPASEDDVSLKEAQLYSRYTVGAADVLQLKVIQPEQIELTATVSPDGFITFPYIGNIYVKKKTLTQIQEEIERSLSDGYMKYPTVAVTLQESKSRNFFVYGEVNKPGEYPIDDNTTILQAISMAGGFTKYGSSSRVKVLKSKPDGPGYETLNVNIKKVMQGRPQEDVVLNNGDIVVVSEGIF